jgi:2-polyprenyl-6-methoxyphenol hydroxylase-like FAD-dependent oxidoreductase/ABC-type nitrate/sulfonate/bicarbonate transport system substrate-binding protein
MKAIIAGGGIGGLTTALTLHQRGIDCRLYEQAPEIRELGVGINILPHAIRELAGLGLLDRLDAVGIRTRELIYVNRFGQEVWREARGLDAGHDMPQFSIHRGALQGVIHRAVLERLGPDAVVTDRRLGRFLQDDDGVSAHLFDRSGSHVETVRGDVLIGADGIHSIVRSKLFGDEGPPRWGGAMMWRGATEWPTFLTGRSMIIAGGLTKAVVYPIASSAPPSRRLTNWVVVAQLGEPSTPPPRREDWSRPGRIEDLRPHLERFAMPQFDLAGLIEATARFFEYPMCDREPLPRWSHGRVTLLGDAAHPMYPVGSNGASQAILDARSLADALAEAEHPVAALERYERERRPMTTDIVLSNRVGGPEEVIEVVEKLAPHGFDDVEAVLPHSEREAIVRGYAAKAGFAVPKKLLALLLVVLAAALGACGGGDDEDSARPPSGPEPATLKVGVIPIADVAPLYLGVDKGFFRRERLTIEPQLAEGGAAITPAVVSGKMQFGFSNTISLLIAASKDLPVQIVAQGTLAGRSEEEAWADLLVLKDGPIKEASDLEGKTIAINTLNNICEVAIKASLEKEGVDVAKLRFTEVPFPEMNAALEARRVDGACGVEPFVSQGKAGKARGIDPFLVRTAPDLTVATYFTSRQYAEENAGIVDRFVRAINRSLDYAQRHPDEVRRILPTYTKIPPEAARAVKLPVWRQDLNLPTIELQSRLSQKYGLIEKQPDLDELIRRRQ